MTTREMTMLRPASPLAFAGLMSALMSACIPYYGPDVNEFAPVTRPAGIAAVLDLGSDTLRAEILGSAQAREAGRGIDAGVHGEEGSLPEVSGGREDPGEWCRAR